MDAYMQRMLLFHVQMLYYIIVNMTAMLNIGLADNPVIKFSIWMAIDDIHDIKNRKRSSIQKFNKIKSYQELCVLRSRPCERWWYAFTLWKTLRNCDRNTCHAKNGESDDCDCYSVALWRIAMAMTFPFLIWNVRDFLSPFFLSHFYF